MYTVLVQVDICRPLIRVRFAERISLRCIGYNAVYGRFNLFHKRSPVAVIVITREKSFSIFCVKKILTIGTRFIPVFIVKRKLICNWNFSDLVFCLAINHIKILFFQMNVFFLQIKKFRKFHQEQIKILI